MARGSVEAHRIVTLLEGVLLAAGRRRRATRGTAVAAPGYVTATRRSIQRTCVTRPTWKSRPDVRARTFRDGRRRERPRFRSAA